MAGPMWARPWKGSLGLRGDWSHLAMRQLLISMPKKIVCRRSGISTAWGDRKVPVTMRHGNSVLCIGNDPLNLNLRCALLRQHGWRVLSSGNGHEGILRFGKEAVNAVVVDFNDDGSEAALIIGQLKRLRPEVPVILMKDEKEFVQGATQQASAVVLKSQEALELIDALKAVLPARSKSKS